MDLLKAMSAFELIGQIEMSIILTDEKGITTYVNDYFKKITGYNNRDIIGYKHTDVLQGTLTEPTSVRVISEAIKNHVPVTTDITNYMKNGEPIMFRLTIQPIFKGDLLVAFIVFQHVNSDLQKTIKNVHELRHDIRDAMNYVSAMCQMGRIREPEVISFIDNIGVILDNSQL